MGEDTSSPRAVDQYLRTVRLELAGLDEQTRQDIGEELRGHIKERLEAGSTPESVLRDLGDPREYARAMREVHHATTAANSQSPARITSALLQSAPRRARSLGAALVVLLCWGIAAAVCPVALMKLVDPVHVGLWVGDGVFFIGGIDDPTRASEVLGVLIFPIALAALALAWFTTVTMGAWALRRR